MRNAILSLISQLDQCLLINYLSYSCELRDFIIWSPIPTRPDWAAAFSLLSIIRDLSSQLALSYDDQATIVTKLLLSLVHTRALPSADQLSTAPLVVQQLEKQLLGPLRQHRVLLSALFEPQVCGLTRLRPLNLAPPEQPPQPAPLATACSTGRTEMTAQSVQSKNNAQKLDDSAVSVARTRAAPAAPAAAPAPAPAPAPVKTELEEKQSESAPSKTAEPSDEYFSRISAMISAELAPLVNQAFGEAAAVLGAQLLAEGVISPSSQQMQPKKTNKRK